MYIWEPVADPYYDDDVLVEATMGYTYARLEVGKDNLGWHGLLFADEGDELVLLDEQSFDTNEDAKAWLMRKDASTEIDAADPDDEAFWEMMLREMEDEDNPFK